MCCDKNLYNKVEKLRIILNEISLSLLKDNNDKNSEYLISISEEMDNLINEYVSKSKDKIDPG